jgi:hypothetical protein
VQQRHEKDHEASVGECEGLSQGSSDDLAVRETRIRLS